MQRNCNKFVLGEATTSAASSVLQSPFGNTLRILALAFASISFASVACAASYPVQRGKEGFDSTAQANAATLRAKAVQAGSIRLDVAFAVSGAATDLSTDAGIATQIAAVNAAVAGFQQRYGANIVGAVTHASLTPIMSANFSASGIDQLLTDAQTERFEDPTIFQGFLKQANTVLQTSLLPPQTATSARNMVAIIDFGVDINHPQLSGRVLRGACFSTPSGNYTGGGALPSLCVNGANGTATAPNPAAGKNCVNPNPSDPDLGPALNCGHGTHVAGIAIGTGAITGASGMAPQTSMLAIAASAIYATNDFNSPYGHGFFTVDVVNALDWVFINRNFSGKTLAAVNLSLGQPGFTDIAQCQGAQPSWTTGINRLVNAGVSVVAAAGNYGGGGNYNMAFPACLSNVVSVAATNRSDAAASNYSVFGFNNTNKAKLFAPGGNGGEPFPPITCNANTANGAICAARAGSFTEELRSGTSMSAPMVAGLIARLRDRLTSNRLETEQLLIDTGTPVFANASVGNIPRVAPYAAYREGSVPQTVAAISNGCNSSQVTWAFPRYFGVGSFSVRNATTLAGLTGNGVDIGYNFIYGFSGAAPIYVQVRVNALGDSGEWSNPVLTTPGPCAPNAVTNIHVGSYSCTGQAQSVTWSASSGASYYEIEQRPATSQISQTSQVTTNIMYPVFSGPTPPDPNAYNEFIRVRACNNKACSAQSAEFEIPVGGDSCG